MVHPRIFLALAFALLFSLAARAQFAFPDLNSPCRNGQCDLPKPFPFLPPIVKPLQFTPSPAASVGNGSLVSRSCPGGVCYPTTRQPVTVRRTWFYRR